VDVAFQPSVTADVPWCEFHAALLGFDLVSEIKAGENQGRKLEHDFVVLKSAKATARKEGGSFLASLHLAPETAVAKRQGIAIWVALPHHPEPLQSVGGWISPE
jgi:hypothetical protein